METAKISIIMPVYNTVDYLEKSIESVREQTFPEFELICVDDGSSDGSLEILQEYAKKDTRIKVFQHEHDGRGAAGARNMALEQVTGEYIAFLDSDDYYNSDNILAFMYQLAKRIRKYNGMQIVITQNIKDFVGSPEIARKSSAIINVSQYSLIFSLSPNDMKDLCSLYEKAGEINEAEAENIINLGRGSAFLITTPANRTNIRIVATPYVRQLFEN